MEGWEPTVKAARLRFWLVFAWPISFFLLFLCSFSMSAPVLRCHRPVYPLPHHAHSRERGHRSYLQVPQLHGRSTFFLTHQDGVRLYENRARQNRARPLLRSETLLQTGKSWSGLVLGPGCATFGICTSCCSPRGLCGLRYDGDVGWW